MNRPLRSGIEQEPSLGRRAVRSKWRKARGSRPHSGGIHPFRSSGVWNAAARTTSTTVGIEWPLDLFRRSGRIAVADLDITTAQLSAADRERLLASEVRMRYGDVLATVRDLAIFDELVAATQGSTTCSGLASRRALRRRSSATCGCRAPTRAGGAPAPGGRTETAVFELKRVLGMKADATLTVRATFEDLVQRESAVAPQVANASMAVEQRADVREAAARIETAVAKIDRAQSEGRFDVSLFGNYMRMDAGPRSLGLPGRRAGTRAWAVQLLVCRSDAYDSRSVPESGRSGRGARRADGRRRRLRCRAARRGG